MDHDELACLLTRLDIPQECSTVLGVWPDAAETGLEVHLSSAVFWRVVKRLGVSVTSAARPDLLLPHRHAFTREGVTFLTFSVDAVLPPGTLTPGYALRLT